MRAHITSLLRLAVEQLLQSESIHDQPIDEINIQLNRSKDPQHGEYASNVALILSKPLKSAPAKIADKLIKLIPIDQNIKKVEIAGPGFINFFLHSDTQNIVIKDILEQKNKFGQQPPNSTKVCLEFVSANPTGPLHVGHGRGAAFGASLTNLLKANGFEVTTEYYVNDAGRQMDILATSVWLRYLDLTGVKITFPINGYQGDYIWDIAAKIHQTHENKLKLDKEVLYQDIRADEPQGGDKEKHIDDLIGRAKSHLQENYQQVLSLAIDEILNNIQHDLKNFGVEYDNWFSERSLTESGEVAAAIESLERTGKIYTKKNTKWFKSQEYGDEKDRVVVRENGLMTYFASDLAYHKNKFERNFDKLINIWGADHHGYIARVNAGISALGFDDASLTVLLVQFANLYRDGEKIPMSTRSGSFVTLRELYDEVGVDAARFFYIMRKSEQHLDFDLSLAKAQSAENPVYYIQYAHARTHSVMQKLKQQNLSWDVGQGLQHLSLLNSEHESALIKRINQYQDTLSKAGDNFAPHTIAYYLQDLANEYHAYYNSYKFIIDDEKLRNSRLCLINAVQQVIRNSLNLLGVSAPDKM